MQCVCEYFFILAKYIFVFDMVAANVGWLPRARFFCKNLRKNLVVSKICCTFAAEF